MIKRIITERGLMYGVDMTIIMSVKISGCKNVENLKTAINFGVNRFESLRSRILQDTDGEAYYVLREQRVNPPIEIRNYHTEIEEFSNEQKKIPFHFNEGEMIRFVIEDLGDCFNMRIVEQHLGGDGRSVVFLVNEIMKNLQEIEEGTFTYQDKPMIPLTLITKEFLDEEVPLSELLQCAADEYNKQWKKEKRIFTYEDYLEKFNEYWSKHETGVKILRIDKNDMSQLVRVSKEKHISINNIILTSVARSFGKSEKILVVADSKPERSSMGNYAGSVLIEGLYDDNKSFWENASFIQNQVRTQLAKKTDCLFGLALNSRLDCNLHDAITFDAAGCIENEIAKNFNDVYGGKNNYPAFMISNLGLAELASDYGKVKVEEIEVTSPKQPGGKCNCGIITANGIMNIVMEYDKEAEYDYERILEDVENTFNELVKEEGILLYA